MQSPIGSLIDARSMLYDVSGAGNNWAHGHHAYGSEYGSQIMELVRAETEQCDSLQGFLLMHSLGGGTGSGLGTYLLRCLEVRGQNAWNTSRTADILLMEYLHKQ